MFELLFLIGLIACIGFAGRWIYERTRIPTVLILLAVGFALGPLGLLSKFTIIELDLQSFRSVAPLVGAVAIISLVFESGLRLKIEQVSKRISFSTAYSIANFAACAFILSSLLYFFFGWNLPASILLAVILAGPSSFAVYSILPFVRTSNQAKGILYFEATLATMLTCVIAVTVMRYASPQTPLGLVSALQTVFSSFSVSLLLGLASGVAILWALYRFKIKKFGYFMILSALLMLYFVDFELLGGIGVISIAVIGLVIGNSAGVFKLVRIPGEFDLEETSRGFQEEISLFITTFFFVYLGMVAIPGQLTSQANLFVSLVLVAGILAARKTVLFGAKRLGRSQHNENVLLEFMIPRDFLSATLSTLVLVYPGAPTFSIEIVILVIVFSAVVTAAGVRYYENKFKDTFLFKKELRLRDGREIVLRTINRDDFVKIRRFLNDLVREGALIARDRCVRPEEEKEMERESLEMINRGDMIYWVCEREKSVVARAVAKRMDLRERDNVALSLYVSKDFRGKGLGTLLLRMLVKESKKQLNPHNIYLSAYANNSNAIKLYEKEGFEKMGRLPEWGKYQDSYLDEIYMIYRPGKTKNKKQK